METNEQVAIIPVKADDRDGGGHLLPEARERVLLQIDEYIKKEKKVNITDISKRLGMTWGNTEALVQELVLRWDQEDKKHLKDYKKRVLGLMRRVLDAADAQENITSETVRVFASLLKDLTSLDKPEGEAGAGGDPNRAAAVHFNNINLSPAMINELRKTLGIEPNTPQV